MENLESLANEARNGHSQCEDPAALDQVRVDYLGKKGSITGLVERFG